MNSIYFIKSYFQSIVTAVAIDFLYLSRNHRLSAHYISLLVYMLDESH